MISILAKRFCARQKYAVRAAIIAVSQSYTGDRLLEDGQRIYVLIHAFGEADVVKGGLAGYPLARRAGVIGQVAWTAYLTALQSWNDFEQ